ncbi:MAG: M20/M25/M40 family metallo-hydrolase [Verrucomicrobiales bacterium]|nr:M20/M25/M40 family metallo-hydrolase [Verrucomicrobiales bacterium]
MITKIRKWLLGLTLAAVGVLAAIWAVDFGAGRCPLKSEISDAVSGVSRENLRRHVESLSAVGSRFKRVEKGAGIRADRSLPESIQQINRDLNPYGLALTGGKERDTKLTYLEDELRAIGLTPRRVTFETEKIGTGINLITTLTGKSRPEKIIDVTAHYDTVAGSPGADDNNSGVAGVLEIARILTKQDELEKTVRFVFFDFEELGLVGSRAFVKSIDAGKHPRPELCLNLEMIGYFVDTPDSQQSPARIPILFEPPTVGNTIVTVGNFNTYRHGRRLDGTYRRYVPDLPVFSVSRWGDLLGNASRSDHYSYWEAEIPALMLTDTANFRNPHYHKPTDRPETLDFDRMKKVVQGAAAFVLDWAND